MEDHCGREFDSSLLLPPYTSAQDAGIVMANRAPKSESVVVAFAIRRGHVMIVPFHKEVSRIEQAIDDTGPDLSILEAGCGRKWQLKLTSKYRLIGIDVDESALRIRKETKGDLADYRVGSVCDDHFPADSFDVIYCSYVLEHVVGVEQALSNFARWLKPSGLLVLRVPDDRSVYGWIAKHTPQWFHIFARKLMGDKTAGHEGHGPYPVVYERAMSLPGLRSFAQSNGFRIVEMKTGSYLKKSKWLKPFVASVSIASFGFLKWRHADFTILMQR